MPGLDHEVGDGQLEKLHDLLLGFASVLHLLGTVHGLQQVDEGVAGFVATLRLAGIGDLRVCFRDVWFTPWDQKRLMMSRIEGNSGRGT